MSQGNIIKEFSLPIEFDSYIMDSIALPPKIVLEFNTQYQKIISIKRPGDVVPVAGRINPAPASYHDRSVIVLPEEWEKSYNFSSSSVLCKLVEPSFAKEVQLKRLTKKESKSLPLILKLIEDKSVIFEGCYIREDSSICKVVSINGGSSHAITTDKTLLKFGDKQNGKQYYVRDENREDYVKDTPTVEDIPTVEEREIKFENLHKVKGISDTIKRLKNEVVYPFIDIVDGHVSKPEPMGGVLLYGPTRLR